MSLLDRQARIPMSSAVYTEAMLWMHCDFIIPSMEADLELNFEPSERQMV